MGGSSHAATHQAMTELKIIYSPDGLLTIDETELKTGERTTAEFTNLTPEQIIALVTSKIRSVNASRTG